MTRPSKENEAALSHEELKRILHYNAETGEFTWIVRRGNVRAGSQAGTTNGGGYRQIAISGTLYLAHRLAWFYMTGKWPSDTVDHKDGNRANNAWRNLRHATNQQNLLNHAAKNYYFHTKAQKYMVRLKINGKDKFFGYHDTEAEAAKAADALKRKHYGEWYRRADDSASE